MIKNPGIERPFRPLRRPLRLARLTLFVAAMALVAQATAADETEGEKANAHLLQAEIELQRNQYKAASEEYRKAAELSDDIEIARQATRVSYSYGFNEDALDSAERWLELDEENDEAMLYVAQLQLRNGELRDSRRTFMRLLERGEEPVDERLVALIPFLSEEDPEDADWLMRQLAKPYKDSASAHYAAGVMALQAGDTDEARARSEKAIELQKDWIQPHLLYARALLLGGDQDAAIDYAARMVGDNPDPDPEARLELAIMYLSAERDDDALSQVNQVLLEQPARTDALRLMAIINFRQDHLDAAQSDFQDLLSSGRYTMDALYYLARIADRHQEYDEAIALYSQVISGENTVAAQRRVSGIMAQEGEPEEALLHLVEFGETHPNHAIDMMAARAQLLASLDRYPEALELYDQVVEYRPDSESVALGKAELLLRMGKVDDAIDLYRDAVDRWPDSAMSMNALGYTLADRTDEYKEAARLIEKALELEPDSPAIIDSWGWVLYKQGEHEQALKELERAYEQLKDPEVAAHIVEVLWKLERVDEAKKVLEDAEVLFPENEILENVRKRVFP
ncbi:MAG TPA: tetratricopeptide repeat protein [Woeseiaceae bacterium]|nr:tetratricopeptide repeat protein [Woeseiaceae bacterium]